MASNGDTNGTPWTDLQKAGRIRLGLFLPQYAEDAGGRIVGIGAGEVAISLLGDLAEQIGIKLEVIGFPTPPKAIEGLQAGTIDVSIIGIEPHRVAVIDFTSAVIRFDYTYLVPAGSPIRTCADVDRPGTRISVVEGHASYAALKRLIKQAEILGRSLPDEAFALLRDDKADTFAMPREQILDYVPQLAGSRVLEDGYGINDVGFAAQKGRSGLLGSLDGFVDQAKASGRVQRILDDAGLAARGFTVGPLQGTSAA